MGMPKVFAQMKQMSSVAKSTPTMPTHSASSQSKWKPKKKEEEKREDGERSNSSLV